MRTTTKDSPPAQRVVKVTRSADGREQGWAFQVHVDGFLKAEFPVHFPCYEDAQELEASRFALSQELPGHLRISYLANAGALEQLRAAICATLEARGEELLGEDEVDRAVCVSVAADIVRLAVQI